MEGQNSTHNQQELKSKDQWSGGHWSGDTEKKKSEAVETKTVIWNYVSIP